MVGSIALYMVTEFLVGAFFGAARIAERKRCHMDENTTFWNTPSSSLMGSLLTAPPLSFARYQLTPWKTDAATTPTTTAAAIRSASFGF